MSAAPRKLSDDLAARDAAYRDFDRSSIGDDHTEFAFRAGWERAARVADAKDDRIKELERTIAAVQALLPGPRTFAESLSRDITGKLFPRLIDVETVAAALEPAGDVLARERAIGAHDALDTAARHLNQPGILWHGDSGVTVDVGHPRGKGQPLTSWLLDRADEHKQKATNPVSNIAIFRVTPTTVDDRIRRTLARKVDPTTFEVTTEADDPR